MSESTELYTVMSKIGKDIKEIKEIFKEFVISLKALVIHVNLQEERRAEALNPSLEYTKVEEEVKKNLPKLPKSTKKIDAGAHRISTTTCNQCGGLISWDMRPERKTPLHVDENGHIKGTGDCPEWEAES